MISIDCLAVMRSGGSYAWIAGEGAMMTSRLLTPADSYMRDSTSLSSLDGCWHASADGFGSGSSDEPVWLSDTVEVVGVVSDSSDVSVATGFADRAGNVPGGYAGPKSVVCLGVSCSSAVASLFVELTFVESCV